jgi:molybdopterin/thiamine biosynthesis adenylyltransferase
MSGQTALKHAAVLVVGAGGLGSSCLLYLAAAGVGHIGICDADTVDSSNLQRQVIHGTSSVGQQKGTSAQQRLHDLNPLVRVCVYDMEFTAATAGGIVERGFLVSDINNDKDKKEDCYYRPYDIIVDGSDNFPTKYLIKYVYSVWLLVLLWYPSGLYLGLICHLLFSIHFIYLYIHIWMNQRCMCHAGHTMGLRGHFGF